MHLQRMVALPNPKKVLYRFVNACLLNLRDLKVADLLDAAGIQACCPPASCPASSGLDKHYPLPCRFQGALIAFLPPSNSLPMARSFVQYTSHRLEASSKVPRQLSGHHAIYIGVRRARVN